MISYYFYTDIHSLFPPMDILTNDVPIGKPRPIPAIPAKELYFLRKGPRLCDRRSTSSYQIIQLLEETRFPEETWCFSSNIFYCKYLQKVYRHVLPTYMLLTLHTMTNNIHNHIDNHMTNNNNKGGE